VVKKSEVNMLQTGESTANEIVDDGFATVRNAEKFLGLCRAKIYHLMDAGEIRYAKFGKSRRIPWVALREYATRCLVG